MDIICSGILRGEYMGWNGHTLFSFENGQHWVQAKYAYHYHYKYRPRAQIVCENGTYYLQVEGESKTLPVKRVSTVIQSRIDGVFKGWSGHTRFPLINGQIWEQAEYAHLYHYACQPEVTIYDDGYDYRLSVDGQSETITVRRV